MTAMEKQRNIIDYTLSSLWRRRSKNISLLVVYSFVIFLLASVMFFTYSIKKEASLVLDDAPQMMVQRLVAGRQDYIPVSYADGIRRIRGVQSVRPRLWGYYYDAPSGANFTLMADEDLKGRSGVAIVGKGVTRTLKVDKNGSIPLTSYDGSNLPLTISEVLSSSSELVSADLILVSEEDFRRIFTTPVESATDLILEVRNPKELSTVAAKITQLHPDTRPILKDEILRTYDAVFDWRGGLIVVVLAGAFLAFVILAWDRATGLSAEERKEIGVLKAIGWETSDILLTKFWEGAVISLTAFFVGVLLAYAHVFLCSSVLFEPVLKGWSVLYPHFRLTPHVSAYQLATLFFLTVVPYTVATIVPSWRSATIDPDSVMRA
jgi:ABC-type lipoprotein release transport system permease subunit